MTPELIARKYGHFDVADLLEGYSRNKENGTSCVKVPGRGVSQRASLPLKTAIQTKDLNLCRRVIQDGADMDAGYAECLGCTPLLYTLHYHSHNAEEIAVYLVSQGASIRGKSCQNVEDKGYSAFHYAASLGFVDLLRLLLERDLEGLSQYSIPFHPIHLAITNGHAVCVQMILDYVRISKSPGHACQEEYPPDHLVNLPVDGENLVWQWGNFPARLASATPLQTAAFFGRTQIAASLMNQGSRIHDVDAQGSTALHFAAMDGNAETVKLFLASGADVNTINSFGHTPLIPSIYYHNGNPGALQALIKGGADLEMQDYCNRTIYHHAAEASNFAGLVFLLTTTTGWDIGSESANGESILSTALKGIRSPQIMSFLLKLGADHDAYLPKRSNMLTACFNFNSSTVKMLLRRLPKAHMPRLLAHQDHLYGTPLYAASTLGIEAIIILFLEAGAALELEGGHHGTPLLGACAFGRLEAVKVLVRNGALIAYEKNGQVVSSLQKAKHFPEIIRWLLFGRFQEGPKLLTAGQGRQ